MTHRPQLPSRPGREPQFQPWLRLALAMTLPVLWLVAGLAILPSVR